MLDKPSSSGISRRKFLGRTSVAGAAMLTIPALAAQGADGANERLSIGIIGCGDRSRTLMRQIHSLTKSHNCEITAVCDVWQPNLNVVADRVKKAWGKEPRKFTRFGDVLALKDVDAVVIATPDFSHCQIMIAALEAGKDVYCEKPMAQEIESAGKALDLARAKERVVQVGTQRRSDGRYPVAAGILATGVLGKISRVTVGNNFNHARWARPYDNCKAADVDWDAYLFNRPKREFDPRLLRRWHFYKMCTNGLAGLWMTHHIDAIHMLLGSTYPASAVAHGGTYVWKDGREHCDTFHALLEYPEEYLVSWAMGLGNEAGRMFAIFGTKGALNVNSWTLSPAGGKRTKVQERKIVAEKDSAAKDDDHMGNWLECIRSRQRPNADIQYGYQHSVATIMAAAALHTGRRQKYDPERREMTAG
jgi:predicted dehydrogenase